MKISKQSTCFLLLGTFFISAQSYAAEQSLDCTKPTTKLEKRICNSKELRLLAHSTEKALIKALNVVTQPAELRRIHRTWQSTLDMQGGYLPTAYKNQIKWLEALSSGLALDTRLGRYAYDTCPPHAGGANNAPRKCSKPIENELYILPDGAHQVRVNIDSFFMNGHTCGYEGIGVWKPGQVLITQDVSELDLKTCTLKVAVTGKKAVTTLISADPEEPCRPIYCGMHGTLDDEFSLKEPPNSKVPLK